MHKFSENYVLRHPEVWRNGGIIPRILKFGTRWRWLADFKPWTLYPWGKSSRYQLWVGSRAGIFFFLFYSKPVFHICPPLTQRMYEYITKSFRTKSITKYMITTINTSWDAAQRVMAAKLTRLTHKVVIQLHIVAKSCNICSSRSGRPVRKLLDTLSFRGQMSRSFELSLAYIRW